VLNLAGEHDFNEVHFEDVMVPEDCLVGTLHEGWRQVSAELAYERSGPERWLSTYHLLARLVETLGADAPPEVQAEIGGLMVDLVTLRRMSLSVAGMLEAGEEPNVQAALVKEIGTRFEQRIPRITHRLLAGSADYESRDSTLRQLLEHALMWSPAFTIRGGTTEILRGIIARGLGLR
jgi:alkylation response protein AidB-like acyl-CoA dehydrogenase